MMERAANCLCKGREWKEAALLFRDAVVPRQPARAAECFEEGGLWSAAAASWASLGTPVGRDRALECCTQGRDWDQGISLVKGWLAALPSGGAQPGGGSDARQSLQIKLESFAKRAARGCLKRIEEGRGGSKKELHDYVRLLSTDSALLFFQRSVSSYPHQLCAKQVLSKIFTRRFKLVDEELQLHLEMKNFARAADMYAKRGDTAQAVEIYCQSGAWDEANSSAT